MAKRYLNLRSLVNGLQQDYRAAKVYPFFPRYTLLRGMINDLMRSPAFIEVHLITICEENFWDNLRSRNIWFFKNSLSKYFMKNIFFPYFLGKTLNLLYFLTYFFTA